MKTARLCISLLMIWLTTSSYALPNITSVATPKQSQQQQYSVEHLLQTLNKAERVPLTTKQLSHYAAKDVTISSNGRRKARGLHQVCQYLKDNIQHAQLNQIHLNSDELIVAGNNVVAHYYFKQKINGHWQEQQVMANFTFNRDGKIARWSTVSA